MKKTELKKKLTEILIVFDNERVEQTIRDSLRGEDKIPFNKAGTKLLSLFSHQQKELVEEIIQIDDFFIKNIHGIKGLRMKKYVFLDKVLELLEKKT